MIGEKLLQAIVDKGGDIIKELVPDKDLGERLSHEWRTQVQADDTELRKLLIEAEQDFEREQTKRIQAEQASNDTYTKRTRPKIARLSFYFGSSYILAHVVTTVLHPWGVPIVELDWTILGAMYSPALAYTGVRSIDKWRNGGKA